MLIERIILYYFFHLTNILYAVLTKLPMLTHIRWDTLYISKWEMYGNKNSCREIFINVLFFQAKDFLNILFLCYRFRISLEHIQLQRNLCRRNSSAYIVIAPLLQPTFARSMSIAAILLSRLVHFVFSR